MTLTYKEQLLHPNWQRKRLEILSRADFSCEACGDCDSTLHVHHKRYVKGRMAWEYDGEELVALCEECHANEHSCADQVGELIARLPIGHMVPGLSEFLSAGATWIYWEAKEGLEESRESRLRQLLVTHANSDPNIVAAVTLAHSLHRLMSIAGMRELACAGADPGVLHDDLAALIAKHGLGRKRPSFLDEDDS